MLHALTAEFPLLLAWIDPPKAPLRPQIELSHREEGGLRVYEIRARIADIAADELQVRVGPDAIEVEGMHQDDARCGLPPGELRFARRFQTPGVDTQRVTASFVDGELLIRAVEKQSVESNGWARVAVRSAA